MKLETLIEVYPRLFHMAHEGAWPSIRDHGLLSVEAILDLYEIEGDERERYLALRRPDNVAIAREGLPGAVLRDQKPMRDSALEKCLDDGLSPADWYRLLNAKSFFWLSRERIWRLLGARAYRNRPQTVLTLSTERLVAAYRESVWLSPINSGATLFKAQRRGLSTFKRIEDFPFDERKAEKRRDPDNVVELVVERGVPDIRDYVLAVHQVDSNGKKTEIWKSGEAGPGDHP